jgi:hypothetical protein
VNVCCECVRLFVDVCVNVYVFMCLSLCECLFVFQCVLLRVSFECVWT